MSKTEEQRQKMIHSIERVRRAAVDQLLETIYQNPYWEIRYGEKGRKFTHLDADESIKKLTYAISMDLPNLLTDYYHWLQGLLVHRGMCTRQIQESIDGIANQLSSLIPEDWAEIEPYWRASYDGLVYSHPSCQALAQVEPTILEMTLKRTSQTGQAAPELPLFNPRYTLSYLYDGVGMELEAPLENYLIWVYETSAEAGEPADRIFAHLDILKEEIHKALPAVQVQPFLRLLERAVLKTNRVRPGAWQ